MVLDGSNSSQRLQPRSVNFRCVGNRGSHGRLSILVQATVGPPISVIYVSRRACSQNGCTWGASHVNDDNARFSWRLRAYAYLWCHGHAAGQSGHRERGEERMPNTCSSIHYTRVKKDGSTHVALVAECSSIALASTVFCRARSHGSLLERRSSTC